MSIGFLAQAIMAMGLGKPDSSRARPSSLLKDEDAYAKVFSDSIPLAVYLWAAQAQRAVDTFLITPEADASAQERTNLRFHLAALAASKLIGTWPRSPHQLSPLASDGVSIEAANLLGCLSDLRSALLRYRETHPSDPADKIAKGSEFVKSLHGPQ